MMKVTVYIEKTDFDEFFQWINRLNHGILTTSPVRYATSPRGFSEALQLSMEPGMYMLIQDAETDLSNLEKDYGKLDITFEPMSQSWEIRTISDILRNSRRHDVEADVVYTALYTLTAIPGLTPGEAMIIAEREWINNKNEEKQKDI